MRLTHRPAAPEPGGRRGGAPSPGANDGTAKTGTANGSANSVQVVAQISGTYAMN
mgnify:CR=1 FL=1